MHFTFGVHCELEHTGVGRRGQIESGRPTHFFDTTDPLHRGRRPVGGERSATVGLADEQRVGRQTDIQRAVGVDAPGTVYESVQHIGRDRFAVSGRHVGGGALEKLFLRSEDLPVSKFQWNLIGLKMEV